MTMYLSNSDVRPTGFEAGEFIADPDLPRDQVDHDQPEALPAITPPPAP